MGGVNVMQAYKLQGVPWEYVIHRLQYISMKGDNWLYLLKVKLADFSKVVTISAFFMKEIYS